MKQQICFSASCCCDRKNRGTHRCEARYSSGGCAARRSRGADELRQPALGGQPQFIGCYSAPTVFTASNLKAFSQILCFRMCCTDQFPAPFALCAAVCAFRGWGGVFTHQSPLKRALRRLWAMCERSLRILFRQRRNESYRGEFFLLTMPCFGDCSPLFTRSIKAQDKGPRSQAPAARPQSPAVRGFSGNHQPPSVWRFYKTIAVGHSAKPRVCRALRRF